MKIHLSLMLKINTMIEWNESALYITTTVPFHSIISSLIFITILPEVIVYGCLCVTVSRNQNFCEKDMCADNISCRMIFIYSVGKKMMSSKLCTEMYQCYCFNRERKKRPPKFFFKKKRTYDSTLSFWNTLLSKMFHRIEKYL